MWIMTDEENSTFVYELNESGVNRWSFSVQAGFDNDGKRTTEEELHKVAKKAAAAEELVTALKYVIDLVDRDVLRIRPSERDQFLEALEQWNAVLAKVEESK